MAKEKSKPPDAEQMDDLIRKMERNQAKIVEYLRQVILSADGSIGEQIKWNSPSFYYTGEMKEFDPKEYKRDILVMNLHKGRILLVFPSGYKINDPSGLLEGDYPDGRRLITITDLVDAKSKENELVAALKDWVKKVDK
jgi:hypothetical protein